MDGYSNIQIVLSARRTHGKYRAKVGITQTQTKRSKALRELDQQLRTLDPDDPVKYDFALFGLGVFESFSAFDKVFYLCISL